MCGAVTAGFGFAGVRGSSLGVPVQVQAWNQNGRVRTDEIPAGRLATLTHQGHYDRLIETTAALLDRGKRNDVIWSAAEDGDLTTWGARVERYVVGPPEGQNAKMWCTDLAIMTAEAPGAA